MFDLSNIETNRCSIRCFASLKSSEYTEQIRAAFIGPVRQINMFSDLYAIKERLILESPNQETLFKIADILNHSVDWEG